jgi:hypothetical protein
MYYYPWNLLCFTITSFQNICLSKGSKATDFGTNRFSTSTDIHNFVQFFEIEIFEIFLDVKYREIEKKIVGCDQEFQLAIR